MSPPSRVYASSGKENSDEADRVAADARRTCPPPRVEEPRRPVAATPRDDWTKARRDRESLLDVIDRRHAVGLLKRRGRERRVKKTLAHLEGNFKLLLSCL